MKMNFAQLNNTGKLSSHGWRGRGDSTFAEHSKVGNTFCKIKLNSPHAVYDLLLLQAVGVAGVA